MENHLETEMDVYMGQPQHRLGTELSLIFACCDKLRESTRNSLSGDQLMLLQKIQRSAEAIRDLRPELTAGRDTM
jgi:hypothetical protein